MPYEEAVVPLAQDRVRHLTVDERLTRGKQAADGTPPTAHDWFEAAPDRPDPVGVLDQQNRTREPDLVPVRHGRMSVSPFTFYRGSAAIMAADLATTPRSGLDVQLCGDAHLYNFGGFASPERTLLFDLNDFDETLPGPFEYDVKRLAASFTIAARHNGFEKAHAKTVTRATARAYREAMAEFAAMRTLDVWYSRMSEADVLALTKSALSTPKDAKNLRRAEQTVESARTRDSLQALHKLAEHTHGSYRIKSVPPIVVPIRDLAPTYRVAADEVEPVLREQFRLYRSTLEDDRRHLLERFSYVDGARKVVGVGSVGTRAFIILLQGRDPEDVLFLQVKEATSSVLEGHLPRSPYKQHGERVVNGQRLMQAASDIFLGWTRGLDRSRYFYWRQLRDMKASARVETMTPSMMELYARMCGWTLARAHARSGDAVAITAYLGDGDAFDRAVARFGARYADQNEQDYATFLAAIDSGRLQSQPGM